VIRPSSAIQDVVGDLAGFFEVRHELGRVVQRF
jgi:hypothetical protein